MDRWKLDSVNAKLDELTAVPTSWKKVGSVQLSSNFFLLCFLILANPFCFVMAPVTRAAPQQHSLSFFTFNYNDSSGSSTFLIGVDDEIKECL